MIRAAGAAILTYVVLSLIWPHEGRRNTIVVVPVTSCPDEGVSSGGQMEVNHVR